MRLRMAFEFARGTVRAAADAALGRVARRSFSWMSQEAETSVKYT
jgi:hypothetical protein